MLVGQRDRLEDALEDAGLTPEVGDKAYSETVPAGRVVATDPEPGAKVADGGTVTLTISLGKERYDVPKLAGKSEDQARAALADTHLAVGTVDGAWSDTVPKGDVVSTSPKAGTTVRPDTAVDLVVSKGPAPVKLKDWVGKDSDDALAWFDAAPRSWHLDPRASYPQRIVTPAEGRARALAAYEGFRAAGQG